MKEDSIFNLKNITKPSAITLIIVNLIVLFFSIIHDWTLYNILILFWSETAIIAFYFILRLPFIDGLGSIFTVPFFTIHIGGFMFGHLIAINVLSSLPETFTPTSLVVERMNMFFTEYWFVLLLFFISHGVSFLFNFLGKKEYKIYKKKINGKEKAPRIVNVVYKRIIVMHTFSLLFIFPVLILGQSVVINMFIILSKILFDFRSHTKEHMTINEI